MLINLLLGGADYKTLLMCAVSSLVVIFFVLPIHEFAHGFTAVKLGDYTPKYQGRLTLNPFAHIDYLGAISILVFGFGWAKPVQVNMRNFKKPKADMAITALAGPVSNIIFAFVSLCVIKILIRLNLSGTVTDYVNLGLYYLVLINITLAVFNLLPIPPLDGSRLLNVFLPDRIYYKIMRYEHLIIWGVFILLWIGVLDVPMDFMRNVIYGFLNKITFFIFRV